MHPRAKAVRLYRSDCMRGEIKHGNYCRQVFVTKYIRCVISSLLRSTHSKLCCLCSDTSASLHALFLAVYLYPCTTFSPACSISCARLPRASRRRTRHTARRRPADLHAGTPGAARPCPQLHVPPLVKDGLSYVANAVHNI